MKRLSIVISLSVFCFGLAKSEDIVKVADNKDQKVTYDDQRYAINFYYLGCEEMLKIYNDPELTPELITDTVEIWTKKLTFSWENKRVTIIDPVFHHIKKAQDKQDMDRNNRTTLIDFKGEFVMEFPVFPVQKLGLSNTHSVLVGTVQSLHINDKLNGDRTFWTFYDERGNICGQGVYEHRDVFE